MDAESMKQSVPIFTQRSLIEIEKPIKENSFSIVTYNTLAESIFLSSAGYDYCKEQFKKRGSLDDHRHKLLTKELAWLDADIVCLQEVDADYFHNILAPELEESGYKGFFIARSDEYEQGLASFYKKTVFDLEEHKVVRNNDIIQQACEEIGQEVMLEHLHIPTYVLMVALKHRDSGKLIVIGNVHLKFDWYGFTIRQLLECCLATKIMKDFVDKIVQVNNGQSVPYILCGDFNIEPNFPAYKVLSSKRLSDDDYKELEKNDFVRFSSDVCGAWPDPSGFKGMISDNELKVLSSFQTFFKNSLTSSESTYKVVLGKEPEYTNFETIGESWALDYLWHSSDTLQPVAVLDMVPIDKIEHLIGFPNEFFPSDHLALKAYYNFKN